MDDVIVAPDVVEALSHGRPVVALESTIISHGLPRPDNLEIARAIEDEVRVAGATPATIAVVGGEAHIGLSDDALAVVAGDDSVVKVSVRDLPIVAARRGHGATTVAATAHLAAMAGIRVFATGGLGGVHRDARETWDESADLDVLARTGVLVVCAGVKSILDVGATLERLETLSIGVLGYRTDAFPGFYRRDSGHPVGWRVDSPDDVADVLAARAAMGTDGNGILLVNPVDPADELDEALHDATLASGLAAASERGVTGKDVTPFLLDWFHTQTAGASLATNVALVRQNARVAAEVAAAYAAR
ncbi:pseudouridine-5'-phosphate glycosidase [Jatrophihabitans sp. YIM 134969]